MSYLLMSFAIVVIINKAFKLFKLVLVVYCDSCCHWWYPENSRNQKNVYNAKKPLQTPSTMSIVSTYKIHSLSDACSFPNPLISIAMDIMNEYFLLWCHYPMSITSLVSWMPCCVKHSIYYTLCHLHSLLLWQCTSTAPYCFVILFS